MFNYQEDDETFHNEMSAVKSKDTINILVSNEFGDLYASDSDDATMSLPFGEAKRLRDWLTEQLEQEND